MFYFDRYSVDEMTMRDYYRSGDNNNKRQRGNYTSVFVLFSITVSITVLIDIGYAFSPASSSSSSIGRRSHSRRSRLMLSDPPLEDFTVSSSTPSQPLTSFTGSTAPPTFLVQAFNTDEANAAGATAGMMTECDDVNRPPSLNILLRSLNRLCYSGSDIRGTFVDHKRLGSISSVAHEIAAHSGSGQQPPLTPLAAYCFGHALAAMLLEQPQQQRPDSDKPITIVVGQDPRPHGKRLADAFGRGAESCSGGNREVRCVYTGIATTPACAAFAVSESLRDGTDGCDAAVMVTASHLPSDRNGLKLFTRADGGGMTRDQIRRLGSRAMDHLSATVFNRMGQIPLTSSGSDAVMCSAHVDWMPDYMATLKRAIIREVGGSDKNAQPLEGLTIVLNAGNGSGGFFKQVLEELGADVSGSIHCEADAQFPNGVPNPEYQPMIDATIDACREARADLGIMLDTDADRCGFVVPSSSSDADGNDEYEPLHRNRLIALLGVMFAESHPRLCRRDRLGDVGGSGRVLAEQARPAPYPLSQGIRQRDQQGQGVDRDRQGRGRTGH